MSRSLVKRAAVSLKPTLYLCTAMCSHAVDNFKGKSPNPLVNHRFRPCNGHFIGSQWPMVATTFRESWHQHPTKSTRSSVMITEGFSVRKHQARNHLYAATARVGEIWGSHVLLIYSSLLYILFSTLLYPSLLYWLYSTLVYYSTLLVFTLPFSTLLCSSLLYPLITDSYLYSIVDFCMLFVGHEHTDTGHLQLTKGPWSKFN